MHVQPSVELCGKRLPGNEGERKRRRRKRDENGDGEEDGEDDDQDDEDEVEGKMGELGLKGDAAAEVSINLAKKHKGSVEGLEQGWNN